MLGRNGVGKTTLLATDHGPYALARRHASASPAGTSRALPPYRRARLGIGFVPQEREIFPLADGRGEPDGRGAPRRSSGLVARQVYDFFPSLAERRRNRGNQLSGGEQQMLAIGRALMGNPTLLLMDEPLEGLAPVIVEALLAGLDRLKREDDLAMLLVEQHARLALEFAAETIVLDRGVIVFAGASRELLEEPQRLTAVMGVAARPAH